MPENPVSMQAYYRIILTLVKLTRPIFTPPMELASEKAFGGCLHLVTEMLGLGLFEGFLRKYLLWLFCFIRPKHARRANYIH